MCCTSSIPKTSQENYRPTASDPAAHGRLSGLQNKANELPEIALIRKRVIQTKAAEQSLKETSQGNFRLRSFFKVLFLSTACTSASRLIKNLENSPTHFDCTSNPQNCALMVPNFVNILPHRIDTYVDKNEVPSSNPIDANHLKPNLVVKKTTSNEKNYPLYSTLQGNGRVLRKTFGPITKQEHDKREKNRRKFIRIRK